MRSNMLCWVVCALSAAVVAVGCSRDVVVEADERPNVLLIVVDDLGFADLSPYGSEIATPSVQALADSGVSFSRFYTSPMGAASRAMLMTGVDNHINGFGTVLPLHTANQYMQEGYEGYLNRRAATVAEVLESQGYATYMVGKWGLGVGSEHGPQRRGFQRSFALQGSGAGHFAGADALNSVEADVAYYTEDGAKVDSLPEDFYSSQFFADKMVDYIESTAVDKPLFGYLCFTAPRAPLHISSEWADRAKGRYDDGDEVVRRRRLERQVELGIFPESILERSYDSQNVAWRWMSQGGRDLEARKMEVYAAMVEYLDHSIGLVVEALKRSGRYDNTLIVVMSDNGASPDSGVYYQNIYEQLMAPYNNRVDNIGNADSFVALGSRWTELCNAPYSLGKSTVSQGGISSPLIISGGAVRGAGGRKLGRMDSGNLLYVTDIFPTILDYTESAMLEELRGVDLVSLEGLSLRRAVEGAEVLRGDDDAICFEMLEGKGVLKGVWKARCLSQPYGSGWRWELFNLREDPLERDNLAYAERERLNDMVAVWGDYSERVGYLRAYGTRPYISLIGPKRYFSYDARLRR